jgi:hypothetical protein
MQEEEQTPSEQPASAESAKSAGEELVLRQLSEEQQQEQRISKHEGLLLDSVSVEKLIQREREYTDPEKHWIRTRVWLQKATEIAMFTQNHLGRKIRYLTLPGFYRLDIAVLARANLIDKDGASSKLYVAAFEADPAKFGVMAGQVPELQLFANCAVEDAIVNPENQYHAQLRDLFPFDVVNLDLTTSLTPTKEGPYPKMMQAIDIVLRAQANHPRTWALFLTFRNMVENWSVDTITQLCSNLQRNLDAFPHVREAFFARYRLTTVEELWRQDPQLCIGQCVVGWLVDRAHTFGSKLGSYDAFEYTRNPAGVNITYLISKAVLVFEPAPALVAVVPPMATPTSRSMVEDLVRCVRDHKPRDVPGDILRALDRDPTLLDAMERDIEDLKRAARTGAPDATAGATTTA